MAAAMTLFAERGFDGASIGEIERAAGMAPRSGAIYQHFKGGEEELLRGAIEREPRAIDELGSVNTSRWSSGSIVALPMLPNGPTCTRWRWYERFVAAWAETALAVARRYGIDERA